MASKVTFKQTVDAVVTVADSNVMSTVKFNKLPDAERSGKFLKLVQDAGVSALTVTVDPKERSALRLIADSFTSKDKGSIGDQLQTATPAEIGTIVPAAQKLATTYAKLFREADGIFGKKEEQLELDEARNATVVIKGAVEARIIPALKAMPAVVEAPKAAAPAQVTTYAESNVKVKAMIEAIQNPKDEKGVALTSKAKRKAVKEAQKAQHKAIMNLLGEQMKLAKKIDDKKARRAAKKETAKLEKKELINEGKRLKAKVDVLRARKETLAEKGKELSAKEVKNLGKREKYLGKVKAKLVALRDIKFGEKTFAISNKELNKIAPKGSSVEASEKEDKVSEDKKVAKKSKKKKHKKKKESTSSSSSASSSNASSSSAKSSSSSSDSN